MGNSAPSCGCHNKEDELEGMDVVSTSTLKYSGPTKNSKTEKNGPQQK
jgi:hypothetical protein